MIIYYANMTGAICPTEQNGYYPVHDSTPPEPIAGHKVEQDKIVWKAGSWLVMYKQVPVQLYSASEWLMLQDMGYTQQPTLIYLRLQLTARNLSSPKLDAVESYLQQVLKMFAEDPAPRNDWPLPTVTYQEAIQEATSLLEL